MWEDEIPMEDPDKLEKKLRRDLGELGYTPDKLEDYYQDYLSESLPEKFGGGIFLIMVSYAYVLELRKMLVRKRDESRSLGSISINQNEGGNTALLTMLPA